jgi:formate hydrogenlyase transcriptional activator
VFSPQYLVPSTVPEIWQRGGLLPVAMPQNQAHPYRRCLHLTLRVGETIAHSTTMLATAHRLEVTRPTQSLVPRYESLIRLAGAIRSHRDQKDLFQFLADELRLVVPFDALAQCDHAGKKVNWHFSEDYESRRSRFPHIPKEETVAWWVDQTQEPVVLQVGNGETRFRATIEALNEAGLRSLCALPLSTAHSRLGSLIFASRIADAYSPEEVRFLSLVAGQIALAMDDAFNFDRLKLLVDLTNRVVSKLDLRELLREVSASIRRVMQCDGVGIVLSDQETGRLRLCAFDHPNSKGTVQEGDILSEGASETLFRAFRTGQPVCVPDVDGTADPLATAEGLKSLCHLPLSNRERVLGVLSLVSAGQHAFAEADAPFLTAGCEPDRASR